MKRSDKDSFLSAIESSAVRTAYLFDFDGTICFSGEFSEDKLENPKENKAITAKMKALLAENEAVSVLTSRKSGDIVRKYLDQIGIYEAIDIHALGQKPNDSKGLYVKKQFTGFDVVFLYDDNQGYLDAAVAVLADTDIEFVPVLVQDTRVIKADKRVVAEPTAFHGSPYDFNEFSMDKMGTGDGSQSMGWGMYFSSDKRDAVLYSQMKGKGSSGDGVVYTVNIDVVEGFLLECDTPFKDQSEVVQNALEGTEVYKEQGLKKRGKDGNRYKSPEDLTGWEYYVAMRKDFPSDEAISKYLLSKGVKGLSYGEPGIIGTVYYVIFDLSLVKIVSKVVNKVTASLMSQPNTPDISELVEYAKGFDSAEDLLRAGGFSIDQLDRAAFGFDADSVTELSADDLNIKWKEDLDNVLYSIEKSHMTKERWAKLVSLETPIEVSYEDGKFWIEDGHHRYCAAKVLNQPLKVILEIKDKPVFKLREDGDSDQLTRDMWDKAHSGMGVEASVSPKDALLLEEAKKYDTDHEFVSKQMQNENGFKDLHVAPSFDDTAVEDRMESGGDFSLAELAQGHSTQPADYFDPKVGARYYGYNTPEGMESYRAIRSVLDGKAKSLIAYRTVPKDLPVDTIGNGEWVTFSKKYAEGHGNNRFDGDYKIIELEVTPDQVWWDGNDINEWGYDNGTGDNRVTVLTREKQLFEVWKEAHGGMSAQASAGTDKEYMDAVELGDMAKCQSMVDEAAKAAGYNVGPVYHGTKEEFTEFDLDKAGSSTDSGMWGKGFYFSDHSYYAGRYGVVSSYYLSIKSPFKIASKSDIPDIKIPDTTIEDLKNSDKAYSAAFVAFVKGAGCDGTVVTISGDTEYVVYTPEQAKLATPVAFDDNGEVIPLSKRFDFGSRDIRAVKKVVASGDAVYLAAVQAGDLDKAQEMVNEAAQSAGYSVGPVYHGTSSYGFSEFVEHPHKSEDLPFGFHFSTDKSFADKYAFDKGVARRGKSPGVYSAYLKIGKMLENRWVDDKDADYVVPLAVSKITKTAVIYKDPDANLMYAWTVLPTLNRISGQKAKQVLLDNGYDSVKYSAVLKQMASPNSYFVTGESDTIVVLSPEQIKSADTVTYDDSGNIIPLSARFNSGSKDIRAAKKVTAESVRVSSLPSVKEALELFSYNEGFYDLYPGYSEDVNEDESYMFDTEQAALDMVSDILDVFAYLPDPIPVYRALFARSVEDIDRDYAGESWSFEEESALEFGNGNKSNYLLTAFVSKDAIDWKESVRRFALFSMVSEESAENEVVVADQLSISDIKIYEIKGMKRVGSLAKVTASGVYGFTLQDPVTVAKWAKAIKSLHFEEGMIWLFKNTQGEELTLEVCDLLREFYVEVTGENIRDVRGTWVQNTCPRLVKEAGKKFLGSQDNVCDKDGKEIKASKASDELLSLFNDLGGVAGIAENGYKAELPIWHGKEPFEMTEEEYRAYQKYIEPVDHDTAQVMSDMLNELFDAVGSDPMGGYELTSRLFDSCLTVTAWKYGEYVDSFLICCVGDTQDGDMLKNWDSFLTWIEFGMSEGFENKPGLKDYSDLFIGNVLVVEAKKKHKWEEYSDDVTRPLSEKYGISFGKDKNGYFAYTHRARSGSYDSVDKIPISKLKFIGSTGSVKASVDDKTPKVTRVNPVSVLKELPDVELKEPLKMADFVGENFPDEAFVAGVCMVPVRNLVPTESMVAKDESKVAAIKATISRGDYIQPIVVEFNSVVPGAGVYTFRIIDGHHRFMAYTELKHFSVPCAIVATVDDFDVVTTCENPADLFEWNMLPDPAPDNGSPSGREKGINDNKNSELEKEPILAKVVAKTVPVPSEFSTQVFYHGGSFDDSAIQDIFANGLKGREEQGRSMMAPVKNSVYMAKDFKYALIYAIGGNIIGSDSPMSNSQEKPFGLVFEVSGQSLSAVHPDEDAIGELIWRAYNESDSSLGWLKNWAENYLTPNQLKKIKEGEYSYYAQGGKRLIKALPSSILEKLMGFAASFANEGRVAVSGAYVVDRRHPEILSGNLDTDKSHMVHISSPSEMPQAIAQLEEQAKTLDSKKVAASKVTASGSWQIPQVLQKNYKVVGDLTNIREWKAKTILANSGGKVGEWDDVGYVLIALNSNNIIPVARGDEHQVGYDLLYHLFKKFKLPQEEYVSVNATGANYLQNRNDERRVQTIQAIKKWMAMGGARLVIEDDTREGAVRVYSDQLGESGDVVPFKGTLSEDGSRIVDTFQALSDTLNSIYTAKDREQDYQIKVFNEASVDFLQWMKSTLMFDLLSIWNDVAAGLQKVLAVPEDDYTTAEAVLFSQNGIKNKIHNQLRKLENDPKNMDYRNYQRMFGDVAVAKKAFDAIDPGINVSAAEKKTQLEMGKDIEMEHKETFKFIEDYYEEFGELPPYKDIAEHIAENHLAEFKDYYDRLADMEKIATKASAIDPIYVEARKYETAEEFVKAQGNVVYHGTDGAFKEFDINQDSASGVRSEAVFFSKDRNVAQGYGDNVVEAVLSLANPLEIDFEGMSTVFFDGEWRTPSGLSVRIAEINKDLANRYALDEDLVVELESYGWSSSWADKIDGAVLKNINDAGKYSELPSGNTSDNYLVSDVSLIKTRQQLIDIWNKANGMDVKASAINELEWYRGDDTQFTKFDSKRMRTGSYSTGLYLTNDKNVAAKYGKFVSTFTLRPDVNYLIFQQHSIDLYKRACELYEDTTGKPMEVKAAKMDDDTKARVFWSNSEDVWNSQWQKEILKAKEMLSKELLSLGVHGLFDGETLVLFDPNMAQFVSSD